MMIDVSVVLLVVGLNYSPTDNFWFIAYWLLFVIVLVGGMGYLLFRFLSGVSLKGVSFIRFLLMFSDYMLSRVSVGVFIFLLELIVSILFVLVSFLNYWPRSKEMMSKLERADVYLLGKMTSDSLYYYFSSAYIMKYRYYPMLWFSFNNNRSLEYFDRLCGREEEILQAQRFVMRHCREYGNRSFYCDLEYLDSVDREYIDQMELSVEYIYYHPPVFKFSNFTVFRDYLVGYPVYLVDSLPRYKHVYLMAIVDSLCGAFVLFYTCAHSVHRVLDFSKRKGFFVDFVPHCYVYYEVTRGLDD